MGEPGAEREGGLESALVAAALAREPESELELESALVAAVLEREPASELEWELESATE